MRDFDPDDLDPGDEDEAGWDDDADDGETAVVACPSCGAEVYEDAERCPGCGDFIVHRLQAWRGRPTWWIVLGLLGSGALIAALLL